MNQNAQIAALCRAGLNLVPIQPISGKPTKSPQTKGWNMPRSASNPSGYSSNADDFSDCEGYNFGLYHGASGTLALDLDNLEKAEVVFSSLTDFSPSAWPLLYDFVEIKSPKANRGKLLFKLPVGFLADKLRQFKHNGEVIFELRLGNCQDVIYGQHPEGGSYKFVGDPAAIPEAPPVLLDMLQHWDDWKRCFDSVLGIEQDLPAIAPRQSQQSEQIPGQRDPITEFNHANACEKVLIDAGYTPVGRDRFIRPGSESNAPGAVIMRNCKDGVERVFSHGGDILNDGKAHDAFDCYRLLECDGDWKKALIWDPDITRHNQQIYMLQRSVNTQGQIDPRDKQPFPLISASELTANPTTLDWLLENIIERGSLNLLFGEPGAGKSLFALDWAFCIAAGLDWHGYRTKSVDVVVIAGEGFAGMARRLKALELKYQTPSPARLFISERPANLIDGANAQLVADSINAKCPNPGLIVVDTLHRNMDGDENSSQDIGRFIANLDGFFKPLGVAILVVHHSGHGDKQRSRGSSSIRAAMDGEFSATKLDGAIVLSCHKAKDFEAFKPLQCSLNPVDLDWCDDDGEPLTSVYLEYDGESKPNAKKHKLSVRDEAVLTSLKEAIAAHGVAPTSEMKAKFPRLSGLFGEGQEVVSIEHWRELAYKAIVVDSNTEDAKRKAFRRCRDKLLEHALTVEYENYAWLNFE